MILDLTLCSLTNNLPPHASCENKRYEAGGTKGRNDGLRSLSITVSIEQRDLGLSGMVNIS